MSSPADGGILDPDQPDADSPSINLRAERIPSGASDVSSASSEMQSGAVVKAAEPEKMAGEEKSASEAAASSENLPIETRASVKAKGGKILDIEEAVRQKLLEMNCGDLTEEQLKKEIALVKRKRAQAKQKRIYVNVAFKMGAFLVMLGVSWLVSKFQAYFKTPACAGFYLENGDMILKIAVLGKDEFCLEDNEFQLEHADRFSGKLEDVPIDVLKMINRWIDESEREARKTVEKQQKDVETARRMEGARLRKLVEQQKEKASTNNQFASSDSNHQLETEEQQFADPLPAVHGASIHGTPFESIVFIEGVHIGMCLRAHIESRKYADPATKKRPGAPDELRVTPGACAPGNFAQGAVLCHGRTSSKEWEHEDVLRVYPNTWIQNWVHLDSDEGSSPDLAMDLTKEKVALSKAATPTTEFVKQRDPDTGTSLLVPRAVAERAARQIRRAAELEKADSSSSAAVNTDNSSSSSDAPSSEDYLDPVDRRPQFADALETAEIQKIVDSTLPDEPLPLVFGGTGSNSDSKISNSPPLSRHQLESIFRAKMKIAFAARCPVDVLWSEGFARNVKSIDAGMFVSDSFLWSSWRFGKDIFTYLPTLFNGNANSDPASFDDYELKLFNTNTLLVEGNLTEDWWLNQVRLMNKKTLGANGHRDESLVDQLRDEWDRTVDGYGIAIVKKGPEMSEGSSTEAFSLNKSMYEEIDWTKMEAFDEELAFRRKEAAGIVANGSSGTAEGNEGGSGNTGNAQNDGNAPGREEL